MGASVLPWLNEALKRREIEKPTWWHCVVGVALACTHAVMGGVAALIIGEASLIRQAIAYGLAWPAVLKGAGEVSKGAGHAVAYIHEKRNPE